MRAEGIKDVLDLMEFFTEKGNVEKLSELDSRFHDIILKPARRSLLSQC